MAKVKEVLHHHTHTLRVPPHRHCGPTVRVILHRLPSVEYSDRSLANVLSRFAKVSFRRSFYSLDFDTGYPKSHLRRPHSAKKLASSVRQKA